MVIIEESGKDPIYVNGYDGAPNCYASPGDKIRHVPSAIKVFKQKDENEPWNFVHGHKALISDADATTFKHVKMMMPQEDEHRTRKVKNLTEPKKLNQATLDRFNLHQDSPLTWRLLILEHLKYLRDHLVEWCDTTDVPLPPRSVFAFPLCWTKFARLELKKIAEEAGWPNVELVHEPEAAAKTITFSRASLLGSSPVNNLFLDAGGSSHVSRHLLDSDCIGI